MLGKSLASPLLTLNSTKFLCYSIPDLATSKQNVVQSSSTMYCGLPPLVVRGVSTPHWSSKRWVIESTAQVGNTTFSDEEEKTWESCRDALSSFSFSIEEKDKILKKAFGHLHSPYWSDEREKQVPNDETVKQVLEYLRTLGLSDDDLFKVLKKFPEVLGCSLDQEMKLNVQILAKEWGIEGKTLKSLLLRNPKVLGFNVDCKGDCMAKCTRCWVRF